MDGPPDKRARRADYTVAVSRTPGVPTSAGRTPAVFILLGGLTVGLLDLIDAIVFFGMRGVAAIRIPQSIAAGLLGRAAFQGGFRSAAVAGSGAVSLAVFVNGIFIHLFGVGLPAALFARAASR